MWHSCAIHPSTVVHLQLQRRLALTVWHHVNQQRIPQRLLTSQNCTSTRACFGIQDCIIHFTGAGALLLQATELVCAKPKIFSPSSMPGQLVHRVVLAYCHAMHAWPSISIICSCSAVAKHHCWVFVTSCSWAECPGSAAIQYGVVWCGMVWYGRGSRDRWLSWSRDDKLVLYRLELRTTRRSGFRSPRGEEMIPVTSPHHQC